MSLIAKRILWVDEHGQLKVTQPIWNARLVSELRNPTEPTRVLHFDPPIPAFHLVHELDGNTYRAFGALATWAETEAEFLDRTKQKDCGGQGTIIDVVDDLPDWRWRNAWKLEAGKVVFDIDKARQRRAQELMSEKRKREQQQLPAATDTALTNARSIAALEAVVLE